MSLSPRFHGFKPLENDMSDTIPLTPIRTNNSTTGARKLGEGMLSTGDSRSQVPTPNEKDGFFEKKAGAAGRRKVAKSMERRGSDGESISVNGLGRLYEKIVSFSVVTRYMIFVVPIAMLIATPIALLAVFEPDYRLGGLRLYLFFLWIEIVWLSIWISKLTAKTLPYVFMFLCGVVSSGTRKYATIIRAVEIPLSLVGWAVTALLSWTAILKVNGTTDRWTDIMTKILGPVLIAAGLYLGEKLVIQFISVGYHRRSFDAKIKESKNLVNLLGHLYEASRTLFPMYCEEFIEEDYAINDSIEAMLAKTHKKMHRKSGSATPMRLIGEVGRIGDKVTSVFGNIASEITGKQVFNPNSAHSVVVEALEKTKSSEALAKRLWMSFVCEGRDALYVDDLEEVLGANRKAEANEIFVALDQDGNGDISLDEMIMKVVEVGKERKSIANSMRDVSQAIGVLDSILLTVLFVVIVFVFVAFQDTTFVTTLATAGTTLLSLSFVFAVTTQEFLGSCIFLFVKHPYDVGDRVDINGEFLVVEQISLLFTVFTRIDNMKITQVPNITLNTLWVENISRSKAMKEQLEIYISFDTSIEDIDLLRAEMESFVRHPDNSRDFQPEINLEATGIGSMDKLVLKVEIRHKGNWHNETVRAARRSKFMCALVLALRKIPIYGPGGGTEALGGPTNPGYSVAISDTLAAEAREKAAKAKEHKRLVPSKPAVATGAVSSPGAEVKAAESLNARRPGMDEAHRGVSEDRVGEETPSTTFMDEQLHGQESDEHRLSLLKRSSTKGKRRAGESLPSGLGASSVSLAPPMPQSSYVATSRSFDIDEEAELGIDATSYSSPMSGSNNPYNTTSYSAFPPQPLQNVKTRARKDSSVLGSPPQNVMTPPPNNPSYQFPLQKNPGQQNAGVDSSGRRLSLRGKVLGQTGLIPMAGASPRADGSGSGSVRSGDIEEEDDDEVLRRERERMGSF